MAPAGGGQAPFPSAASACHEGQRVRASRSPGDAALSADSVPQSPSPLPSTPLPPRIPRSGSVPIALYGEASIAVRARSLVSMPGVVGKGLIRTERQHASDAPGSSRRRRGSRDRVGHVTGAHRCRVRPRVRRRDRHRGCPNGRSMTSCWKPTLDRSIRASTVASTQAVTSRMSLSARGGPG